MQSHPMKLLEPGTYDRLLDSVVRDTFHYHALSPDQDKIIRSNIEGHDVLGILPTGGGKSAGFQIPGIVTKSRTLVVSPLIALQEDQIQALRYRGIKAFAFHSGLEESRKMAIRVYYHWPADEASFLYISPELLLTETFHNIFKNTHFDRIAIDEAHCVSTWGDSFRPDYQRIRVAVRRLKIPHCSAFTATVDPRIEKDIRTRTPLKPDHVRVAASPLRPNLAIKVMHTPPEASSRMAAIKKRGKLCSLLEHPEYQGPAIVYCSSRNVAATLYQRLSEYKDWLKLYGYTPNIFHGQLTFDDKRRTLRNFLEQPRPIVIATSAFGMGIDRPDVRQVIHYQAPYTLIDFAQQIGRAGRDGLPSRCTTLWSALELTELDRDHVSYDVPDIDFVLRVYGWLRKRLAKLDEAARRNYDLRLFMNQIAITVESSDQIHSKSLYISKVNKSIALLIRARVIKETSEGMTVTPVDAGGPIFMSLIKLTEMNLRMQVRELERLHQFFESPEPTQELLWSILEKD